MYHSFIDDEGNEYGSFEVFKNYRQRWNNNGWFWWSCFPGCLPDSGAIGPFNTASEAIANAQGET